MQERQVTRTGIGGRDSALGTRRPSPLALSRKDGGFVLRVSGDGQTVVKPESDTESLKR